MSKNNKSRLQRLKITNLLRHKLLIYGLTFGLIGGVIFLVASRAAAPSTAIYASEGNLTAPALLVNDSAAAGGKAVLFTSNQSVLPSPGTWTNTTSNLANLSSECGNLTILSLVPGTNTIIAGVARRGLWATTSAGASWSQLGTGSGSATINNRPNFISYDPSNSSIFYVAGIYGEGVYKTVNAGQTFTRLGDISHTDYVSVDYSDPNRQTLVAGGHEQSRTVYKSTNGGQTWTNIGLNLPAGTAFSSAPVVINSLTYVVSAIQSYGGGELGMFRTTNGGQTWTKVSTIAATQTPPTVTSNGTIYWPTGGSLAKSTDGGASWTTVGTNIQNARVTELPDGRIVTANNSSKLIVSANGGQTWTEFGANLPFSLNERGVVYLASDQSFFAWQWDCGNNVLSNAIMKLK